MIQPLNNHCLIEVIDEYEGVLRDTSNENVQKGILRRANFFTYHLTTSTGLRMEDMEDIQAIYKPMLDSVVYWQEYADAGAKFTIDGKQYVLVPFYRLIGVEEKSNERPSK